MWDETEGEYIGKNVFVWSIESGSYFYACRYNSINLNKISIKLDQGEGMLGGCVGAQGSNENVASVSIYDYAKVCLLFKFLNIFKTIFFY